MWVISISLLKCTTFKELVDACRFFLKLNVHPDGDTRYELATKKWTINV